MMKKRDIYSAEKIKIIEHYIKECEVGSMNYRRKKGRDYR